MDNLYHDMYELIPLLKQAGYNAALMLLISKKLYSIQNRSWHENVEKEKL